MELVRKLENSKKTLLICQRTSNVYERVKHWRTRRTNNLVFTKAGKEMKQKANSKGLKNLKFTWEEKPLHGQYPLGANNADVDQKKSVSGFVAQG